MIDNGLGNRQNYNACAPGDLEIVYYIFDVQLTDLLNDGRPSPIWLAMRHESFTLSCIAF